MFKQLLEQSRQLTAHIVSPAPAPFDRGLDQIEAQSRRLLRAHSAAAGGAAGTQTAAGAGGIDHQPQAQLSSAAAGLVGTPAPSGARTYALDGSIVPPVAPVFGAAAGAAGMGAQLASGAPGSAALPPTALDQRATQLLAKDGFDPERISQTLLQIDLTHTFEPLQGVPDTDVDAYLRNNHENDVSTTLSETKSLVINDFEAGFEQRLARDWISIKKRIFEDIGQQSTRSGRVADVADMSAIAPGTPGGIGFQSPGFAGNTTMMTSAPSENESFMSHPNMRRHLEVVRKLNEARLRKNAFNVAAAFHRESRSSAVDTQQMFMSRIWRLVELNLTGGRTNGLEGVRQGHFKSVIRAAGDSTNSEQATSYRTGLVIGGRRWLEEVYRNWNRSNIQKERFEIGGMPTAEAEALACLKIKFGKNDKWSSRHLETVAGNQIPFWAVIFILVRMGLRREAMAFIQRHHVEMPSARQFPVYFKAWMDSPEGRLPKMHRDKLLAEWNSGIRDIVTSTNANPTGDVFKYALYKLIGRCDMHSKQIRSNLVSATADDYLWVNLMLVQEDILPTDAAHERYTLREFSANMQRYGLNHFGQKTSWFMVLMICGEFERAVAELIVDPAYRVEGIHFAIALAYYGVLRVPENPKSFPNDGNLSLRPMTLPATGTPYDVASFHFARAITTYARLWMHSDPIVSLHYVYLLPMCGPDNDDAAQAGGSGMSVVSQANEYDRYAQKLVVDYVLANPSRFGELLGQIRHDGIGTVPGHVEVHRALLHIESEQEYMQVIVLAAANAAESDSRIRDAIYLYHLAGMHDKVLMLMTSFLSERLLQQMSAIANSIGGINYGVESGSLSMGPIAANVSSLAGATSQSAAGSTDASLPSFDLETDPATATDHMLKYYRSRPRTAATLSPKTVSTAKILIQLSLFCQKFEQAFYENALREISGLNIFPETVDILTMQPLVDAFNDLDDSVARVMPYAMLMTVLCIAKNYRHWRMGRTAGFGPGDQAVTAAGPGDTNMALLRNKAQAMVQFAGMVKYRIPGDIFAKMNRIEVMM